MVAPVAGVEELKAIRATQPGLFTRGGSLAAAHPRAMKQPLRCLGPCRQSNRCLELANPTRAASLLARIDQGITRPHPNACHVGRQASEGECLPSVGVDDVVLVCRR